MAFGLRARLNRLESHAHRTMNDSQGAIELAKGAIEEVTDGVDVEASLEVFGFEIPLKLRFRIDLKEEGDQP